jgi:hypothetical protein
MRFFPVIAMGVSLLFAATNCAPAPTEKVDLSKARATLQLANGSSISTADDEFNPILVQKPDGFLVLVFGSDRPCSSCSGYYNLFVAESIEPVYDPYDLPAFNDPVELTDGGSPLNIATGRFAFQAGWRQNQLYLVYQDETSTQIMYTQVAAANIATGAVSISPAQVGNLNRNYDTLISVDFRTLKMISLDSSFDLYETSLQDNSDTGTLIYNGDLANTSGASAVSVTTSGYTDAKVYELFGQLAYGFNDYPGDTMFFFNEALLDAGLDLSYASAFETELPFINALLFSAGNPGDQHDLYAVDSHTLDELWFLDADYGFQFGYSDNFNIFVSAQTFNGNLGGIYGADFMCNVDDNRPVLGATYKAMLVDSIGTRTACTTANCGIPGNGFLEHADWVFEPSTTYIKASTGAKIQDTDANGLLTFSLLSAIGSVSAWLGFNNTNDWRSVTISTNVCDDWFLTTNSGSTGSTAQTTATLLNDGTGAACSAMKNLVCVEQPF